MFGNKTILTITNVAFRIKLGKANVKLKLELNVEIRNAAPQSRLLCCRACGARVRQTRAEDITAPLYGPRRRVGAGMPDTPLGMHKVHATHQPLRAMPQAGD